MSERTSYTPGTPCWVDLSTPDVEKAEAFYNAVLGWDMPELPNSAEMGGYRRVKLNGKDIAGVVPLMQEGQPPSWNTYVSVDDAAATLAKVGEAGGNVIFEAMDVMGLGTMGVFIDPTGAACGVWQPGTFHGAEEVNGYGSLGWNELGTRDTAAAKDFYGQVFGWTFEDEESERAGTYSVWKVGDAMVGGMVDYNAIEVPDAAPAQWLPYFGVEDTDKVAAAVESNGGTVMNGPMDIPVGRFAVLGDPWGAGFAVMQPSEETLAQMP